MVAEAVDYSLLEEHICHHCGGNHRLVEYPVDGGYVVAVVCAGCRTKTGLPRRYSTESEVLDSLGKASIQRERLLTDPNILPRNMKHVQWCTTTNSWAVHIRRGSRHFNRNGFTTARAAAVVRDEWLEAA